MLLELLNALGYGVGIVSGLFGLFTGIKGKKFIAVTSMIIAVIFVSATYFFASNISSSLSGQKQSNEHNPTPPISMHGTPVGTSPSAPPAITATQRPASPQNGIPATAVQKTLSPPEMLEAAETGKLVYQNQLKNQSDQAGWDNSTNSTTCNFTQNGYEVISNGNSHSVCENNQSFRDVLIEIKNMQITQGTAGLLFRIQYVNQNDRWKYYFFEIDPSKREFNVSIDTGTSYNTLTDWIPFPQGVQSGNTHSLQVITQENNFYLYIDRSFAKQVTDTTYTSGSIGFAYYNQGSSSEYALFSYLSVYDLPTTLT